MALKFINNDRRKDNRAHIWWLNPVFYLVVCLAITLVALGQSEAGYVLEYGSDKYIGSEYVALCCAALLTIGLGMRMGWNGWVKGRVRKKIGLNDARMEQAFFVVTAICIAAYLIWYVRFAGIYGVQALLSVFSLDALSGNMYVYKRNNGSIPGITTLTEVGVIAFVLGAIILNRSESSRRSQVKAYLFIMLLLSIIRALLFSERLAVIELVVPFAVAWFGSSPKPCTAVDRWFPLAATAVMVIFFGLFEYSRSWLTHYYLVYDSFWDYILMRLSGYYTNAVNTEAMYVEYGKTSWFPYWSIQWLWQMPYMGNVYRALADTNVESLYGSLLVQWANPEYNNPGGLLTFYKDFSWLGYLLYFVFGYIVGRSYARFYSHDPKGLLFYPVFVLTMLELPRYFYLGINRGFVVVVGLIIVMFVMGQESWPRLSDHSYELASM